LARSLHSLQRSSESSNRRPAIRRRTRLTGAPAQRRHTGRLQVSPAPSQISVAGPPQEVQVACFIFALYLSENALYLALYG
jgi:hypothetical protein